MWTLSPNSKAGAPKWSSLCSGWSVGWASLVLGFRTELAETAGETRRGGVGQDNLRRRISRCVPFFASASNIDSFPEELGVETQDGGFQSRFPVGSVSSVRDSRTEEPEMGYYRELGLGAPAFLNPNHSLIAPSRIPIVRTYAHLTESPPRSPVSPIPPRETQEPAIPIPTTTLSTGNSTWARQPLKTQRS